MKIATTRFPLPRFGESKPAQQPGQPAEPEQSGQYVLEPVSGDELGDLFVPSSPPQAEPSETPAELAEQELSPSTEALKEEVRTLREQLAELKAKLDKPGESPESAEKSASGEASKAEPEASPASAEGTMAEASAAPEASTEPTDGKPAGPKQYNQEQTEALVRHVLDRNTRGIRTVLENGADPNVTYHDYKTPIVWAARNCNLGVMDSLLNAGANDPKALSEAFYEIINALINNDSSRDKLLAMARRLFDAGASNVHVNVKGGPWLHAAIKSNDPEVIQLLVNAGCKEPAVLNNTFDEVMQKLISIEGDDLARSAALATAQILVDAVVDPQNKANMSDRLRQQVESQPNLYEWDFLEKPSEGKAALTADSGASRTRKYSAVATERLVGAMLRRDITGLRDAIHKGANPNVEYEGGKTPLGRTVRKGDRQMMQVLLESGANDPDELRAALVEVLVEATYARHHNQEGARQGWIDMARLLKDAGAAVGEQPYTQLLTEAIAKGDIEVVQFLRDAGMDMKSWDKDALHVATMYLQADMVKYLHGAGLNDQARLNIALDKALRADCFLPNGSNYFKSEELPAIIQFLLDQGADPNYRNPQADDSIISALFNNVKWKALDDFPAEIMGFATQLKDAGADDEVTYRHFEHMFKTYGQFRLGPNQVREVESADLSTHYAAMQALDDRMQSKGVVATEAQLRAAGYTVEDGWVYGFRSIGGRGNLFYQQDHIYTSRVDTDSRNMTEGIYMFPTKGQVRHHSNHYANSNSDVIQVRARVGSVVLVENSTGEDKGKARTHTMEVVKPLEIVKPPEVSKPVQVAPPSAPVDQSRQPWWQRWFG